MFALLDAARMEKNGHQTDMAGHGDGGERS
jgi:hypothetical protein